MVAQSLDMKIILKSFSRWAPASYKWSDNFITPINGLCSYDSNPASHSLLVKVYLAKRLCVFSLKNDREPFLS